MLAQPRAPRLAVEGGNARYLWLVSWAVSSPIVSRISPASIAVTRLAWNVIAVLISAEHIVTMMLAQFALRARTQGILGSTPEVAVIDSPQSRPRTIIAARSTVQQRNIMTWWIAPKWPRKEDRRVLGWSSSIALSLCSGLAV